jgi:outer membrane protein assembly factor BamB
MAAAGAADWPQWRGPDRTGISRERGLLAAWPEGGPRLLWQVTDLGAGYSTPVVADAHLYVLVNNGVADEIVEARRVSDGQKVWSTRIGRVGNPDQQPSYPGARSSPTVAGDTVFALGSDGDLVSLDRRTGTVRWRKQLRADFGGRPGTWAYAESPLVDGDALVVTPGGERASLVALRARTGDVIWQAVVPGGGDAAYSSIAVVEAGGLKQYVQFLQRGLVGVNAATGAFLWRYDEPATGSAANIATPIATGDRVFATTSQVGGGLVQLRVQQAAVSASPVYFSKRLGMGTGGAVLVDGHVYGTTAQGLIAFELVSGTVKWQARSVGSGSVAAAAGRLYLHGDSGDVALVEATPDAYREHGRFTPPGQPDRRSAKAWAHPVISDGRLYIRDLGALWAYDIAAR